MNSDAAAARDLFYLSAALLGAALGALARACFSLLRRRPRRGSRSLPSALLSASGLGLLSAAFIVSGGSLFADKLLCLAAALSAALVALAVFFPRPFGFPACVAAGAGVILFAWAFLAYAPAAEGDCSVSFRVSSAGVARVAFPFEAVEGRVGAAPGAVSVSFARFVFDPRLPVIGGLSRYSVDALAFNGVDLRRTQRRSLLELAGGLNGPFALAVPGVRAEKAELRLSLPPTAEGARFRLVLAGATLSAAAD